MIFNDEIADLMVDKLCLLRLAPKERKVKSYLSDERLRIAISLITYYVRSVEFTEAHKDIYAIYNYDSQMEIMTSYKKIIKEDKINSDSLIQSSGLTQDERNNLLEHIKSLVNKKDAFDLDAYIFACAYLLRLINFRKEGFNRKEAKKFYKDFMDSHQSFAIVLKGTYSLLNG